MSQLSYNLKLIRLLTGLNQSDFGERFDSTKAMIVSYESGKARPDVLFLERVSKFAKVNKEDLNNKKFSEDDLTEVPKLKTKSDKDTIKEMQAQIQHLHSTITHLKQEVLNSRLQQENAEGGASTSGKNKAKKSSKPKDNGKN